MRPLQMESHRTGDLPAWVAEIQTRGFEHFTSMSMPSPKEEAWRYLDLDFDMADLGLPDGPGEPAPVEGVLSALAGAAAWATVVDGVTVAVTGNGHGAVFTSLREAFSEHGAELLGAYGTGVASDLDLFAAAHAAFSTDGVFLRVPADTIVERPFVVDVQATHEGTISFPHVTVVVEANAEASLVVSYRSPAGRFLVAAPQVEAFVRDGARLALTTVQDWSYAARSVTHQRVSLGRDASVRLGEVGLGGRLGRLDLGVDLLGDGSSSDLVGLYFGEEQQVLDYRVVVNHHGKSTRSDVFLKGAVEDQAESVFTGLLKIWENATKTSTFETNRNLVLSEGAKAHSVPNLEILCDDVVCGHGSTVGPLEEEQVYYVMSRGITRPRAERLLVRGFFEETIRRLPSPEIGPPVREAVNRKFVEAQEAGRL